MSNYLHIVCLDAPSPPNYGGAIDMYYKITALAALGKKIILHYFDYKENRNAASLKDCCVEVHAYPRKGFINSFSLPYIISSRINRSLINRLNRDRFPVLLEGLHCSGIIPYLNDNSRSQFVRYYSSSTPGGQGARIDNSVDMRFSDVNIVRYRDHRVTREVSKQIVAKETVIKKDSVVKEYITVKAKITITTRTIQADGLLQATIRDHHDRRIWGDTYRGDYSWTYSFATFTGDERALSDEDKKLINQREQWPPSNDEIIRIIMDDIQRKTECGISDYFNRNN